MQPHPTAPGQPGKNGSSESEDIHVHLPAPALLLHSGEAAAEIQSGYIVLEAITDRRVKGQVEIRKSLAIQIVVLDTNKRSCSRSTGSQKQGTPEELAPIVGFSDVHD